ncbi:MAG: MATE family efflux transporter [Pirellulales bacterium]|nr:MATE family efflux transporter [Pirellulales bacterium]
MRRPEPIHRLQRAIRRWWLRPCGGRAVLGLALPLLVSTASWSVMNFMDRMFLSWHSEEEFAAALPAGILQFTLFCFPLGIASYVNTFVAQYHGARQFDRIGAAVGQAVRFGLGATPLLLLVAPLAPTIFITIGGHHPAVAEHEIRYFQVLSFGAGAAVLAGATSAFFTGLGRTRVVMVVMVSTNILNVFLDWLWIFGSWGFPEMGITGAGLATVSSQWTCVAVYLLLMMRHQDRDRYALARGARYDSELMHRLLYYGMPNGLQMLLDCLAISIFLLLLGRLGTNAMAATTLAFNVNSVAFVPMLGMGIAVSTMVGQQLGAERIHLATRATWTAFHLAMLYTGGMAILYIAAPDLFFLGHASGMDPESFAAIRQTTVILLRFVAAYCLFDAMNIIFVSAIKGAGDTRFILMTNLFVSPLPVLAGWIGLHYFHAGLIYCWWVITIWVWVLGMIYLLRFLQGRWKSMRVIETDMNIRHGLQPLAMADSTSAITTNDRTCANAE